MSESGGKTGGTLSASQLERSQPIVLVLQRIAAAFRLIAATERAYRRFDARAERLHAAAECAHRDLLRSICELSEQDADRVEPDFTRFETKLLQLRSAPEGPFRC